VLKRAETRDSTTWNIRCSSEENKIKPIGFDFAYVTLNPLQPVVLKHRLDEFLAPMMIGDAIGSAGH